MGSWYDKWPYLRDPWLPHTILGYPTHRCHMLSYFILCYPMSSHCVSELLCYPMHHAHRRARSDGAPVPHHLRGSSIICIIITTISMANSIMISIMIIIITIVTSITTIIFIIISSCCCGNNSTITIASIMRAAHTRPIYKWTWCLRYSPARDSSNRKCTSKGI